jgi:CRP-like cAMP-binding protein
MVRSAALAHSGERGISVQQNVFAADRKLIQALELRSQPFSYGDSCILFRQGDAPSGLFILQTGEVVLMRESVSGKAIICLHAGPGSLLGLPGMIGNEPYTLTAMARKGSAIRFVTRSDFEDVMQAEPSISLKVLQVLAAEVRSARLALS